jgi:hypothetical protein
MRDSDRLSSSDMCDKCISGLLSIVQLGLSAAQLLLIYQLTTSPCHNIQFEGVVVRKKSDALIELKAIYESHLANGPKADMVGCEIGNSPNKMYLNNQETCQIVMKVPEDKGDLDPPIMIHYELFNFYQNYRK